MHTERIWMDNALRNFNYLVACPASGEALAIDPLDADTVLAAAKRRGWTITQVLNTHEHGDHIAGNAGVVQASGASLLAPAAAGASIPDVDTPLQAGDCVRVGDSLVLDVLETPGHTMCHISLFHSDDKSPSLFCADTVFNAGVGNCHNGGDAATLYRTCAGAISGLPGATRIYPGHEYFETNLRFTLAREPHNKAAQTMLGEVESCAAGEVPVTTLAMEREYNVFFRLSEAEVVAGVRATCPELGAQPSPGDVFIALRGLRDRW